RPGVQTGSGMSQRKNGQDEEAGMGAGEQTGEGLPERWRAGAQPEVVVRLLKGEEVGPSSREVQGPRDQLEARRRQLLWGGRARDEGVQAARQCGGGARTEAGAGKGRRTDDEARDRGVVSRKKRLRGGVEEVEALRGAVSPGTQRRYPVALICAGLRAPRSSVYAAGVGTTSPSGGKRGPKTTLTDEELLVEIRAVLPASPFHSEGHRKVHF